MDEPDTLILGGGIAGLACAVALCDAGQRVAVLEGSDTLGGRARSCTDTYRGDRVDLGPHILLSEYHNMLRLLDRLGTRDRVTWQQDKFLTLVDAPRPTTIRMAPLPAPLHLLPSLLRAPQVSLRELASNTRLLWQVMRLDRAGAMQLDNVTAEDFLHRMGVRRRFIDWFWRTACMAVMNVPLECCSAGALFGFFRYMLGISGVQVGFAGEGLGDLFAPAARQQIEQAGGTVCLGTQAVQLLAEEGRAVGVRLADGHELRARHIVAALPPDALQALLSREWLARYRVFGALAGFKPSPYICTYLWFDRKLTHERFWSKVWSPQTLNYDFYDLSNIRQGWGARGSLTASNIIHCQRAAGLTDEQVIAATLRELCEYLPAVADARLEHARVHRIPMAIPAPLPGSQHLRPPPATPIEGLFLAGDWIDTGLPASMESAVRAAWLAAEQVLAAAGRPTTIASPLPAVQGLVRLVDALFPSS